MDQNTFIVSPTSQYISLTPGQTYSGAITITNPSGATADITYQVSLTPYNVIGEDYTADLATISNYSQIVDWATITTPTGTITPNSSTEIPFTITVPANAPAGGQYAAIIVSQTPSDTANTVGSSIGIASIIYADVAGTTTHSGQILDNSIPGFSLTTPISVSVLVGNTGNVHETATIELSVVNSITGEHIFPQDTNSNTFTEVIMPDSTRLIMRRLDNLPSLGIITVTQTVYYNGDTSTITQNVILCPIWFIALVILAITSIILTLIFRSHSRKTTKNSS